MSHVLILSAWSPIWRLIWSIDPSVNKTYILHSESLRKYELILKNWGPYAALVEEGYLQIFVIMILNHWVYLMCVSSPSCFVTIALRYLRQFFSPSPRPAQHLVDVETDVFSQSWLGVYSRSQKSRVHCVCGFKKKKDFVSLFLFSFTEGIHYTNRVSDLCVKWGNHKLLEL